jgi:hypothetical protein
VKNIRETRFLGLSARGLHTFTKETGFLPSFSTATKLLQKTRFLGFRIPKYLKDRSALNQRVRIEKPGFCVKSGEDTKNIRETRFLGLCARGFMHFHQRNRVVTKFFDCDEVSAKNPVSGAHNS